MSLNDEFADMLQEYIMEVGPQGVKLSDMADKFELLTAIYSFPMYSYQYQGDQLLNYLDRCMQEILKHVLSNPDFRVLSHGNFNVEPVDVRGSRTGFKVSVWVVKDK